MLRPDPIGGFDIATGLLLYQTVSPLPEVFAAAHAAFLVFKGVATVVAPMPVGGMPVYMLGTAADIISAGILFTGSPPIIGQQLQQLLSLGLFLKGVAALPAFMG